MQDRKGVISEGQDGGHRRGMGVCPAENDSLVAKMEAIKKPEGEMPDGFPVWGGGKRIRPIHVRRIREISGREMRWRAR